MKLYLSTVAMLAIVACVFVVGCGQNDSSGENIVPGMIRDLSIKQSEDHVELYGDVAKVCAQIDVADDAVSKSSQYDELAKRLVSFDFTNLASGDRVLIFGDYWRSLALVCAKMADEGSLTPKSFAVLLKGWKKCRDMCNLPTSDNTPDAAVESQVRGDVRTLRCLFENDAALFERDVLRLILKNRDVDAKRQSELYDMWHRAFGCRVKEHSEYQGGK